MADIFEGSRSLSIEEKRKKITSNYEIIEALKFRLDEIKKRERTGMNRAAYIKMIMDVTKKVEKQNQELSKIVLDTRKLQREVGNLSGRLDRSFTLVENTILKNSKNDAWRSECYRLLGTMHENCDQLINAVQGTGEIAREIKQIEDQLGRLKAAQALTQSWSPVLN